MELNRDQIIKALEWCIQSESCEYCEYKSADDIDVCGIRGDALALIKELTEENQRLRDQLCELNAKIYDLQRELEGKL